MNQLVSRLEALVDTSLKACQGWLSKNVEDGTRLVDPVDQEPIVSHYGDSHLATALLLLARMRGDKILAEQGIQIIQTVLRDWNSSTKMSDFHHDFNNFALCLFDECLDHKSSTLSEEIRRNVLLTRDSNHDTVNWLPMRAYVNYCRHDWTNNRRYERLANDALTKVSRATNADGGIEDRLPRGSSYNLQYNLATLATLQLLSRRRPAVRPGIPQELGFLLERVLPDGDINYTGRGTNQIFAWGPWLYLLACTGQQDELDKALHFLEQQYPRAAENKNILLNPFPGVEKSFWWDYHYSSVYHAHFLLWSTLALRDYGSVLVTTQTKKLTDADTRTGLRNIRGVAGGVCVFAGSATYLAEAGPALCALWLSDKGILFKGGLGPLQGKFGKKYSYADTVFLNHFGLVSQEPTWSWTEHRVLQLLRRRSPEDRGSRLRPVFAEISVAIKTETLEVVFETKESMQAYLNVPIFAEHANKINLSLSLDGHPLQISQIGRFKGQYCWIDICRSRTAHGRLWKLEIK